MDKKEYSFVYIRYKFSNVMLLPVCLFLLVIADRFEQIDSIIVKVICNILAVLILILIYNRASNHIFQRNGKINMIDSKRILLILGTKVTEINIHDIEKVMVSINKQFRSRHIELIIKTTEYNKIKIVSKRYFNGEDLSNHAFMNVFYDIKSVDSGLYFESAFDGTFLTLERNRNAK